MKSLYSIERYTIELIFICKLKDLKWYEFRKRKEVHEWRKAQLKSKRIHKTSELKITLDTDSNKNKSRGK